MGTSQSTLTALKENLTKIDPRIAGMTFYDLPYRTVDQFDYEGIARKVNEDGADIVWVALGAPKQEIFMSKLKPHLKRGVLIAVGAAFKFYSGQEEKRAPQWMIRHHLEFVYRIFSDPKKQVRRCSQIVESLPRLLYGEWKRKKEHEKKERQPHKRVFVSGCYDMLHSGHVAFFKAASQYGDLYVGIGSDATIEQLKKRKTVYSERERLYMVKAIRYVTDAFINPGSGMMDFVETVDRVKPDVFVVNSDGGSDTKREFCRQRGIEYIELERTPEAGLEARSTTNLRKVGSHLPYRIDLAGTWIDQPYVSCQGAGWAITISIEPTTEFMERAGMSTSTRNAARKIWPYELPAYNEEMLARLLFCFENDPEHEGHISGAQDAIGICMSGLCRHYYDNRYWPSRIETCHDEEILSWLESHLCLVPMFPRRPGTSVVEGKDITPEKVKALTTAANRCWEAIQARDLPAFAQAYQDSFEAQIAMFPGMMAEGVQTYIDAWRHRALAWKMTGAGGGGYLALVVEQVPEDAIAIKIRRYNP